jgi:acyl dehydratase/putative sterol carrier protein
MALNMDAIGKKLGPLTKTYTWKDVVLYALGVGAGFNEPNYTYEKKLKVIPTFSVAIIFDLFRVVTTACNINVAGVLHGEQDLIFHNPIPPSGTMTTEGKITNYYDKGTKGALVVVESETFHGSGKKLFTSIITLFSRLDGGFGGKSALHKTIVMPEREPDFIVEAKPSPDQPLIYRLSGDTFELHVDTEFAKIAGFEKPIMHGLCTYGFACRALVASLTPGEPEMVRRLACRFAHPLYPGEPIKTLIWKTRDGEALWQTVNAKTGDIVIDRGVFEYNRSVREFDHSNDFMGDNIPHLNTKKEDVMENKGLSGVEAVFKKMPEVFNTEAAPGMDVTFQFSLSGEGGGDWYAEVKGGNCKVEAGISSNPTSTIKMDAGDFLDMIGGRLNAMQAFMSGKLKVEGDIMKAQLIAKMFKF